MPTPEEHLIKYKLNRKFLDSNGGLGNQEERWATIVAFYAALHLVERLAARESRHHTSHAIREEYRHFSSRSDGIDATCSRIVS